MIKRTDMNMVDIMNRFRQYGFSVFDTSTIGRGYPDLNVAIHNHTYLIEIKTCEGKLNEKQKSFQSKWNAEIEVIHNPEEVDNFARRVKAIK